MDPVTGAITAASFTAFAVKTVVSTAISMAVSWLFAPDQEGPRLDSLKATGQGYGPAIPTIYGRVSVPGSIIWASDIIEKKKKSGGKGGGGKTTTYKYSQHVAIGVCRGPAYPKKIWMGGKLVVDFEAGTSLKKIIPYAKVTVYNGTEAQTANSLIQSYMGAADTPAYRGMCYIVLQNLQLEKFGNRLPPFQVEVSSVDDTVTETTLYEDETGSGAEGLVAAGGYLWYSGPDPSYDDAILKIDPADGTVLGTYLTPSNRAVYAPMYADATHIWGYNGTYSKVFKCDMAGSGITELSLACSYGIVKDENTGDIWRLPDNHSAVKFNKTSGANVTTKDMVDSMAQWTFDAAGTAWAVRNIAGNHELYKHDGSASNSTISGLGGSEAMISLIYDWDRDSLWIITTNKLLEYDIASDTTSQRVTGLTWTYSANARMAYDDTRGVVWFGDAASDKLLGYSTTTYALVYEYQMALALNPWGPVAFDAAAVYIAAPLVSTGNYAVMKYASAAGSVALSEVVADICDEAGLNSSEYDVTDLSDQYVDGYAAWPKSAREKVNDLRAAYWFDGAESEGKVKFRMRGSSAVATIPEDDLAASNGNQPTGAPLVITRMPEEELPRQVEVEYIRKNGEYETAVQHDRVMNTESTELGLLRLPLVLDDFRGRDVASVSLYTTRLERTSYQWSTSKKYTHLEPLDVVNVVYDGATYRIRITEKDEGGGTINFKGVPDDQSLYVDIGVAATSSGFYTATVNTVGGEVGNNPDVPAPDVPDTAPTTARFMDLPALVSSHNIMGLYLAAAPNKTAATDDWEGAVNFYSLDGGTEFLEGSTVPGEAVLGICSTTLGDWTGGNRVDFSNVLRVVITGADNELASTTRAGLLNGANAAVVGSEVLQFQTATLISSTALTKTYDLSNFLRGRLGTEQYIGTHSASETFTLLDGNVMLLAEPEARLGTNTYRTGTVGEDVDDLSTQNKTNTGNILRPYSPVHIAGGKSATANWDILLQWVRRERLYGQWTDYVDATCSEPSELYDIEIYTDDFVTLKRTVSSSAGASYTYANADQVTDFGSTQSSIGVKVYQLSTRIGRGFAGSAVVSL